MRDTEVMITGYPTIEGCEGGKDRAEEYLTKPFTDEELFSAVRRPLDKKGRRRKAAQVQFEKTPSVRMASSENPKPCKRSFVTSQRLHLLRLQY